MTLGEKKNQYKNNEISLDELVEFAFSLGMKQSPETGQVDAIVMHMELNLNSTIKVKLLEKGYQRMADLHNEYIGQIRNWEWRDKEYYENKADENGYTEFQFWHFMECFGEVTSIGMADYYETTVLIRKKDLKECV